jgi:hypothetical protein
MSTADKSSRSTGPTLFDTKTSEPSEHTISPESTCSVGDSPARTSRSLAKELASRVLAAVSGVSTRGSWASYDPASFSLRTSQRSLFVDSTECSVTLPRLGTMRCGLLYGLPTLALRTCESGCLSWPTPTVFGNHNRKGASVNSGDGLSTATKRWETPTVNGASTNSSAPPSQRKRRCKGVAVENGSKQRATAQSRVGGGAYGFSRGLDGPWPAAQGETQAAWEPPRVAKSESGRIKRLAALGNAVVPQVAYAVGLIAREIVRANCGTAARAVA